MRTRLNGIEVTFTDEGAGPSLLFVHGFPLSRGAWVQQVAAFKPNHRVIAPDLRGFGETEATAGPVTMTRFAEDLHALMEHLKLGPVTLVGHSMGGYIALAFAAAYPEALQGLVLVSTKAGPDGSAAAGTRRSLAERVRMEGTGPVIEAMGPKMLAAGRMDPAMTAAVQEFMRPSNPTGTIAALLGMAIRPDMQQMLRMIQTPALVVSGTEDSLIPDSESRAMVWALPNCRLALIPGGGHLVAFECAEAFNKVLGDWLEAHAL
jgi:pimeloyl-ACP methyl ester carboxylesterase